MTSYIVKVYLVSRGDLLGTVDTFRISEYQSHDRRSGHVSEVGVGWGDLVAAAGVKARG